MYTQRLQKRAFNELLTSTSGSAKLSRALAMFLAGMGGAKLFGASTGAATGIGSLLALLGYNTHLVFGPGKSRPSMSFTPAQATLSHQATGGNGPLIPDTNATQHIIVGQDEHSKWKADMLRHGAQVAGARRARNTAQGILNSYSNVSNSKKWKQPQTQLNMLDKIYNVFAPADRQVTQEYLDAGRAQFDQAMADARRDIRKTITKWSMPEYDYMTPSGRKQQIIAQLKQKGYPTRLVQQAISQGGF